MLMMPNAFVAVAVSVYLDMSEQNYIWEHWKWREMIELASDLASMFNFVVKPQAWTGLQWFRLKKTIVT